MRNAQTVILGTTIAAIALIPIAWRILDLIRKRP